MSDEIENQPTAEEQTQTEGQQQDVTPETSTESDRFDFVLDRYRADGRSEQDALVEQAKGYNELRKQFGEFTGAPEEYETSISDELAEAGVELIEDDPMLEMAKAYAKESNMSQEGFNGLVNLYLEGQLSEHKALEQEKASELEQLGPNSGQRIEGINKWIDANLDPETADDLRTVITSAKGVKAVEQLINKTRNAPVAPDATPAPQVSEQELQEMQFAKDEHGNRKINTDPAFKREYMRKMKLFYGDAEHRQTVG